MVEPDITSTSIDEKKTTATRAPVPVLLIAHAARGAVSVDRCRVPPSFTVGRKPSNDLAVQDHKISGTHFQITSNHRNFFIEDLSSTNGTYLHGERLTDRVSLKDGTIIRAGRTLFIFHTNAEHLLSPPPIERFGMAGRFHVTGLLKDIEEAACSKRHLLILGPSGSGKELASNAIASMSSRTKEPLPLLAHNAARFSSEEEATSTLFGVASRVFSNVAPRPGLIEQAEGGILFLDEIHNLTVRVQRSLLRVIEDHQYSRIGDTSVREANVRFVFASNADDPANSMAHDLFARLRLVMIPPLRARLADIPAIFNRLLADKLAQYKIDEASVLPCLTGEHYELMCLDGFPGDNVRGLIDLADRIATKITTATSPSDAVTKVFAKRFHASPSSGQRQTAMTMPDSPQPVSEHQESSDSGTSTYEKNKSLIISTYQDREENISATMRVLRAHGVSCSRRWLAAYLEKWGVKRSR